MSASPYALSGSIVDRLRAWLKQRNPKLTDSDIDLDTDLIASRALDSLSSLDFILFIEEMAGCEIDTSAPNASASLRTLRTIRDVYFAHVIETVEPAPTSRKSLSVLPPRIADEDERSAADPRRRRPLTYSQARYWYLQEARPETAWNVPAMLRIEGPLDIPVLERALAEIVRRHDALRTKFDVVDGVPMQAVVAPFKPEIPIVSVEDVPEADRWRAALKAVERECELACDPIGAPPWRAKLVRLGAEDHVVVIALDHITADLESLLTLPVEIAHLYRSLSEHRLQTLPVPPMQYSDFSEWHANWLKSAWGTEEVAFRRKQFADARPVDFGNGGKNATRSEREGHACALSSESAARLEILAADERATPVAVAMTAVATLLHRRFRQDDVVLMMVSSYRSAGRKTNGVVGNFTNQVPLRISVAGCTTFRDLLHEVRRIVVEGIKFRDVPTQLVFETENPLDHPLAAVLVNWMNLVDYDTKMAPVIGADATMTPMILGIGPAAEAPLHGGNPPIATLVVRATRSAQGLDLTVSSAVEVLTRGMAKVIAEELHGVLQAAAANPDMPIGG